MLFKLALFIRFIIGNVTLNSCLTADIIDIADNESPPKSKKVSSILISESILKTDLKILITLISMLFLGATIFLVWLIEGAGNNFLSTFPLAFSGNLSICIIKDGTIYDGRLSFNWFLILEKSTLISDTT